ncbi:MAG: histidine phosphatase family protein [Vulcanimicrobiota bacterium]
MKEIYLIRHGETELNRKELFRGRMDVPLNDCGRLQAESAALALSSVRLTAVYSSPLKRAAETAAPLAAQNGISVTVLEGLNDVDCGDWEGRSVQEVRERFTDLYRIWEETPHRLTLPGGESLATLRRRAYQAFRKIVSSINDDAAAIVSHRIVLKVLILAVLGLSNSRFWQIRQDNGAISLIQFSPSVPKGVITYMNDTSHLRTSAWKEQLPVLRKDF